MGDRLMGYLRPRVMGAYWFDASLLINNVYYRLISLVPLLQVKQLLGVQRFLLLSLHWVCLLGALLQEPVRE